MTTERATNYIGEFINSVTTSAGQHIVSDLAKVLEVSSGAISRWSLNKNGVHYATAQKLAFLFEIDMDDIVDEGFFDSPVAPAQADLRDFSEHIIRLVDAGLIKNNDFRLDISSVAEAFLKLTGPPGPATSPIGDRMPKPEATEAPAPSPLPKKGTGKDEIRLVLFNMEKFRKTHELEWIIREDGSLGAQRVTVEDF